ncbi:MAG: class I tRNA ligase family protein [Deltaproteobacteria bacterium]|nr:class I tRNA ligase family protein [Deltaproteobacteria bacterium]
MIRFLVTAALPYANGEPHVGHIAGCYLPCDVFVRYLRLNDAEVRYVCGSDDYGVAIMLSAEKEGKSPAEVAKHYNEKQKSAFAGLNINFDVYGSTSQTKYHTDTTQQFFLKLHEQGYFEKLSSTQFFDPIKNVFLPDRFVKGTCSYCQASNQNGDQCEDCGKMLDTKTLLNLISVFTITPAVTRQTGHWFLYLSKFESLVKDWLDQTILRETTKPFVEGLLTSGLVKLSMTRDIS